ncbi:MAG: extracellular solute-binding protein, partial [Fimbriimonadaceae bacterium]
MRFAALLIVILLQPGCQYLPGDEPGKIIIRLATWGGAEDTDSDFNQTIRGLWREFERENPGVVIREEKIPGSKEYVSKMLLSFVAGTEPDIMSLDASSAAIFIENGVLKDLRPLIDKDPEFKLDDYYENAVKIASRGEKVYAIPGDFTPMVVYYNRKLFDEAGVPYPRDNWTYDDFIEKAKKLTIPEKQQWGFKFDNWMPGWIVWLWNTGGDVLGTPSPFSDDRAANGEGAGG